MAEEKKTVLFVYSHHQKTSFNAALLEVGIEALKKAGHNVLVSDLYQMKFNPIISRDDVLGPLKNPDHFNYSEETASAWSEGRLPDDIKAEQAKVSAADLIIFQFPLHWMGLPAILKGWCDRVFLANYAFTDTEAYDQGKFRGKKAMLSVTTGAPEHFYTPNGPNGDINVLLWPLHNGIFRLIGFDVLPPHICYSPQLASDTDRTATLRDWDVRLTNIFQDDPLFFIPISKFKPKVADDPLKGMELTEEYVKEEQESEDRGLTVGHHLDRKLPRDSMTKARMRKKSNSSL